MANAYEFGAKYRNEERKKRADKTLSFNERAFAKIVGAESEAVAPYVTGVRRKSMGSNPNSNERNTVESLQYGRYYRDTTAQQRLQDRRDTISNTTTLGKSADNHRKAETGVARSLVNVAYSKLSASNNENYNSNYKSYLDASDRYGESLRKDYWNAQKDRAKSVGRMFTLNDEKRGQAVTDFKKYSNEVGDIQQSRNDLNKLDDSASDQNWIRLQKDAEAVKLLQQYGNAERMLETARNTATANNGLNVGANEQFDTAKKQMAEISKKLKAKGYDVDSAYSTYQKHKQELAVNQMASAGEQFGKNNNVVVTGLVGRGIHQLEKITGAAEMLADKFNYDVNDARNHTPLDIRDIVNSSQQLTAYDVEAEEQARQKLDKFGNISIMGRDFGGTGRVVYDAVTQGIDNTLDSLILGQGLLGGIKATGKSGKLGQFAVNASRAGSIYSQSKYSNLKQGMTTEEAEAKAIEDVGVEIATEMAGTALEKIKLDGVNNKGVRKVIDFSLTGGSEALEEIKGNIISTAIDYVRNGTGSETSQTYQTYLQQALDAGYSDKEAKDFAVLNTAKDKASEGLYEGLVAFLSASGMSAVNASVGAIAENQQNKEIGKQIPNSSVQTLIDMATKEGIVNKDSEASKIANDILTSKNVTTAKLGRLARSVAEKTNADINTNAKANIITIVQQEKGVESDVAQEVAQAVVDNDAKGISKGVKAIVKEIKAGETDFASKVTSEELTRTYLARNNASFVNDVSNGKTNATNLDDYLASKGQLTSKQMQIKMSRVATSKVEDYTDEEMDALASNNTVSSDEVKRTYVKNGQLMAELKDGDIISGDSIQFRNENQSAIYRQLASNARGNEEFVASAIEAYDMMPQIANDNSDRFYSEARHFFRAGQQGITFEQALRYDKGGIMPRDAAAHIFNSGVKAKLAEGVKSYTKTAVTNRKANKGGALTNNSDRALSKAEEGMLTLFAKKTGIDIVIDNLSKGNEGYYNSSTHTITLNGNADESLMAILLHENSEFATAWNNAEMNGLIDKIVEYILTNDRNGIDDEAIDVLEKYHKAYNSGDNKSTYSDTVKEACFNWLVGVASKGDNSEKFVYWLTSDADITAKEKKTLLNSFRELLTKMRDAFRDFFRNKGANERDIDGISKIFDEYLVIVDKAIENSKNSEAVKAVDDVVSWKAKRSSIVVDSEGNELSEQQQEFFKDSKVRDAEGRLIPVYHASEAEFNVFDKKKIGSGSGSSFGKGFYFASYEDLASDYGENNRAFYLNIKNPFRYYSVDKDYIMQLFEKSNYAYDKDFVEGFDYDYLHDYDLLSSFMDRALLNDSPYDVFSDMVKNAGFDGIYAESEIVAFDENQIKLTTNTNPTDSADIRYSKVIDVEQHKQQQFDILQNANPMTDDYHTGIRSVDDIKTFDEAIVGYEDGVTPDFSKYQIEKAKKTGYVTIYSSYPIENGVFVTPSKMEAESYAGGGEVYQKRVPLTDVAWIDAGEGQYANVSEELQQQYDFDDVSSQESEETTARYSKVVDPNLINDLEKEEQVTVYRAMLYIDGKYYPPMASLERDKNGKLKLKEGNVEGDWIQSDEHPELITDYVYDGNGGTYGQIKIVKDNGKSIPVAYNPYIHTSLSMLNDQFESAITRPNIVVVRGTIPKSELNSGYRAEGAKDPVGQAEWKSGKVINALKKVNKQREKNGEKLLSNSARTVYLSRWFKLEGVVPQEEVAKHIKGIIEDSGVEIPYNVVTPSLWQALENEGVKVGKSTYDGRGFSDYPSLDQAKAKYGIINQRKSIVVTTNNEPVLVTNIDSFDDNLDEKEKIKLVKDELVRWKKVPVGKGLIFITRDSRNELLGNTTYWLRKNNPEKFDAKMRALFNPNELILATTDTINEKPSHTRKDDVVDFARGKLLFIVGNKKYKSDVVFAYTKSNIVRLHDVVNIDTADFEIKNDSSPDDAIKTTDSPSDRDKSFDNTIQQDEEKVNRSSKAVEYNPDNLVNDENDDFVEIKNDLREQFAFMKNAGKNQLKRSTMRNEQKGKSGVHASITQLEAIAKVLKKNHNSKINTLDLTNSLRLLYDHIINNDLSVEQAIDLASDTATDILTNTKSGRQLSNFATTVLEDLAKRNVSLSEEQLEAVRNEYGTKKYLNLISGRVGVNYNGNKGNALTDVWEELSASYPSVFDANTKEADMPRQLLEAIIGDETLVQNGLINQYSYDGKGNSFEDEKKLLALEMLKYFQQVPQFETVAEKERKEYEKREAKLNAKIDRLNKDLKDQVQKKKDYVEARQKTKIKQEIRKVRDDLVNRLLNPKGKAYVPADLVSAVTDLVQAIDASSVDYPARIAKYTNLINELKDDDKNYSKKKAEYERVIANATQSMARQTNAIAELESQFNALKKNKEYPNVYNEVISNCLATLKKNVGSTPLHSMTKEQLQQTLDAVKGVQKMVKDSISTINSELKENAFESGRKAIVEANRGKRISKRNPLRKAVTDLLSPERFFRRISGYKTGSVMSRLYEELNEGMHKAMTLTAKANDYFTDLISNKGKKAKELKDFQSTKGDKLIDVGLKDEKGNPVLLNRAFAVDLALTIADKQARNHLVYGGLNLPNLKAYYKGDANAYNYTVRIAPLGEQGVADLAEALEQQLTSYDKLWISQCRLCIDELLTPALNETTLDMYGFKRATVKNYWQINTDKNFVNKPMDTVVNDMSLENVGFMKERINGTNPVYISDVVDKINRMISADSQYVGLLIPIRNFDLIYNTQLPDYDTSVKEAIAQNYGAEAMRYIENLLADLQGNSKKKGIGSTLFSKVRGNYAKAVLTFNLSVSIKQAASYPAAASVLGYKALGKALLLPETDTGVKLIFAKAEKEFIEKYSPLLRYRLMDGAIAEIGEVNKNNGFVDKAMAKAPALFNWIQQIDGATVGRLWYASKYWVSDNMPNLQKNSDEYYKEVAKIFNKAVEQTQPNYTILQRSEFQRNSSEIIKGLCMFMTQRLQNLNIIYDSTANLQAKQEQYKNDKSEANKAELKLARSEFSHAISSQIVSAVVLSVMTFVASAIMGSMKRYRDDDDEVTLASVAEQIGKDSMSTLLGIVPFASDLEEYIESLITGDEYSLSNPTVDAIDDILGSIKKVVDLITKVQKGEADKDDIRYVIENLAGTISKPVGVPLSNIVKTYKAAVNAYKDIKNDEFGTWSSSRTLTENDYYQRYYDALISGDNKKLENAKRNLTEAGKTDKDIHDKMTTLLKTNQDIIDASQEYLLGNISEYSDKLDNIIAYGFDEQQVISAVNSAIGRIETLAKEKATGDETYEKDRADMISYGYDEKTLDTLVDKINSETEYEEKTTKVKSRYTVGDLYDAKGTGEYDTIYDDIKATQMANGKSEEEAEKYIESGIKREWKNNEPRYEEAKTAYENSDYNTYLRLVDELASDSDYSVDEVATMVTGYEHSNGLGYTSSDVVKSLINNEGNEWVTMLRGIDGYYASQGKRRKNYTSYLTSSFAYQYKNAETNSEKVKIIKAMRRAGYSEKKIGELITGWSK